jgi:hypothetical protein
VGGAPPPVFFFFVPYFFSSNKSVRSTQSNSAGRTPILFAFLKQDKKESTIPFIHF